MAIFTGSWANIKLGLNSIRILGSIYIFISRDSGLSIQMPAGTEINRQVVAQVYTIKLVQGYVIIESAELGVGPSPIPCSKLTSTHLVSAINQVTGSESMRSKAAETGQRVTAEDGVGCAVEVINQFPHSRSD